MVARHRTPILTCSSNSKRRTSAPCNARLLEPLPTRRRHRLRQNPNITNRPTYNPGILHRSPPHSQHPTPHTEEKRHQNCSLSSTRSRGYCFPSAFPISSFAGGGPKQCVKTHGFGGTVFNIRIIEGKISVVDDDGGGVGLRRLRATFPRG